MAGNIKVNFSELESYITEISRQFETLSLMRARIARIIPLVNETWEDPACEQFETAFEKMQDETIPKALVLLDTMQALLETVCTTYQETDQTINGMIG